MATLAIATDLVLSPFGADVRNLLDAARAADGGFDGVYTYDHFSGAVVGKPWSRDPFAVLGAIAAVTERVRIGVLVANMVNRHPAQLASAVNTLQSLAPGRVICGVGAGATPGSPFALEQDMIGVALGDPDARRRQLADTIAALRSIWRGDGDVAGVVDDAPVPPIIVGASSLDTVALAAEHADGVNVQRTARRLAELAAIAREAAAVRRFELSVFDVLDAGHPLGGEPAPLAALGAARRTLHLAPPFPVATIAGIAGRLAAA